MKKSGFAHPCYAVLGTDRLFELMAGMKDEAATQAHPRPLTTRGGTVCRLVFPCYDSFYDPFSRYKGECPVFAGFYLHVADHWIATSSMKAVLSPPALSKSLERDRVRPGRDGEHGGGVALVRGPGGGEGADDDAVDQHPEVLPRRLVVAPLGGVEGQHVGAGGPAGDGLAERAGALEEGDLRALGGRRVARGEAAGLAEMPAPPEKAQAEPAGLYWNWPAPTATCSKPGSPIDGHADLRGDARR